MSFADRADVAAAAKQGMAISLRRVPTMAPMNTPQAAQIAARLVCSAAAWLAQVMSHAFVAAGAGPNVRPYRTMNYAGAQ